MRRLLFLLILLASFIGAQNVQGQRQSVKTDSVTVIGTATEYIEVYTSGKYQSATFELQVTELDDSIGGTIDLQATVDDVWVSLDPDSYTNGNTETDATESSGQLTFATDQEYWYIELFDPPAYEYRFKITGDASNDKVSGTTVELNYYLK